YGEQKALDRVSFTVNTGEVVGFLGPNGAGKSTLMKIITGIIPSSEGQVMVDGFNVTENPVEVKKRIGYLPENNPLYPDMYVKEYLEFVCGIYKMGRQSGNRIKEIIGLTGLGAEQHKKIGALSKGYRQRVGLAQALIHDPGILILDEPTSGLDPNQLVEIRNLISEAGREKTVMLSTHIMQEVEAICNRVIIIDNGRIKADDKKEEIYSRLNETTHTVMVEFNEDIDGQQLLSINGVSDVRLLKEKQWLLQSSSSGDIRPDVFRFAVDNHLTVLSLQQQEKSLEEVFRALTG
ncbi:MAG: gliding motility-associated ABC transporter ATP-binding subunit GldA, partial [Bacteroidales bacterium]|nr:gliding motility-associated ABC transporter ATP-binding subunit GldA [Bacteroidales bacterium]